MTYNVNPASLFGAFSLPSDVVDKHIKMAGAVQLKVLLYIFRNPSAPIVPEDIAAHLSLPASDIRDSLVFWADAGLLLCDGEKPVAVSTPVKEKLPSVRPAAQKPDRAEVARRGNENAEIAFLLRESEQKLGRTLRQNEASSLVWLYDDEGISLSVLLMVIEFAISDGKSNIGYIERTALDWADSGVETVADAERKIADIYKARSSFAVLRNAFGLGDRKPGKKELEYARLWVEDWKISRELLTHAYEICVDNTGKYSITYIATVIKKWHAEGVKTVADIKPDKPQKSGGYQAYDSSLFDEMINSIDNK
ncbi:MAG: DnaD domain protein [Clostridia bacterium]|nr:DnaD domain protein [Clostridia bacterium]MBR3594516.1 DnaD domain protein [Clostridia bacterium]